MTTRIHKTLYRLSFWFVVCILVYVPIAIFGGRAEGLVFPVVDRALIVTVTENGENAVSIYGLSKKLRPCGFEKIEWRLGTRRYSTPVSVIFGEGTELRPVGPLGFGPWHLDISKEEFDRTFARVYHDCHWGFKTVTDFYP